MHIISILFLYSISCSRAKLNESHCLMKTYFMYYKYTLFWFVETCVAHRKHCQHQKRVHLYNNNPRAILCFVDLTLAQQFKSTSPYNLMVHWSSSIDRRFKLKGIAHRLYHICNLLHANIPHNYYGTISFLITGKTIKCTFLIIVRCVMYCRSAL